MRACISITVGDILFLEAVAHRTCLASGEWLHGPWTNYTLCLVNIIYGLIDPEDRFFLYLPYDEVSDSWTKLVKWHSAVLIQVCPGN